jgi:hypothetical protein
MKVHMYKVNSFFSIIVLSQYHKLHKFLNEPILKGKSGNEL